MIAFVFPGQGSQRPGMGAPFVDDPAWDVALRARELTGVDVPHLLLEAGAIRLRETQNTQLAVVAHALMSLRVARRLGIRADAAAGHSVGEIAALVAAGVLGEDDALRLVAARGAAMAVACELSVGRMIAVRADQATTERLAQSAGSGAWLAAVNAPDQTVVGGEAAGMDRYEAVARGAGVRARRLQAAGAFHTALMEPARTRLERDLDSVARFDAPEVPVASNVDGGLGRDGDWPVLLLEQLVQPVLWQECVEALVGTGVARFVEFGATPTLGGLVRRSVSGAVCMHARSPTEINLLEGFGEARVGVEESNR